MGLTKLIDPIHQDFDQQGGYVMLFHMIFLDHNQERAKAKARVPRPKKPAILVKTRGDIGWNYRKYFSFYNHSRDIYCTDHLL